MRLFVRISECGSFTTAAKILNTSTGTISRGMSLLETRLRARLLHRTTRNVALTPAGELYLQRCKQILADVEMAEEEASGAVERPVGKLRIQSFASVGKHYVLPAISEYRALYPDVSIKLSFSQLFPELYTGSTDVAVISTSSSLPDSGLISHLLGSSFYVLCASPDYARTRGLPTTPQELRNHECLILQEPSAPAYEWSLEGPEGRTLIKVSGAVEVNVSDSIAFAVRAGMGIGRLPAFAARQGLADGSLIRVLPQHTLQRIDIYALHPSRRYTDARTKTWVEFLRTHLSTVIARDNESLIEEAGSSRH
ncbi:LysR family transcriptional regulator [Trinickia mobilis]|uniref:LysR family transcriptional regulator n=1 Tax=Trinickia mobilis TaxID=2816356 RepID=UPI001A9049CF|nr:LysR family transcriptional regulator [Trinickia mobilis]